MNIFEPEIYRADIVVWLLVARSVFLIAGGFLMLKEPMNCGGKNKTFHYLLSALFFAAAINSIDRAEARAAAWAQGQLALPAADLVMSEILVLSVTILVAMKLGYDFFKYREIRKLDPDCTIHDGRCNSNCPMLNKH